MFKKGINNSQNIFLKITNVRLHFTQAVNHLVYMGITVRNSVLLTAETMCVTYRKELVLDVLQDGWTQRVTQVKSSLLFNLTRRT